MKRKIFAAAFLVAVLSAWGNALTAAHAQNFPVKPIRMVSPPAGGSSDFVARLVAQGLTERLGQPVVVDNRRIGIVLIDILRQAANDGYTIMLYGSTVWLMPSVNRNIHYDPLRDLSPVSLAVRSPNIVTVPAQSPFKSVTELIAYAKANPGKLNYATTGTGNATHLSAELFNSMAGVKIVRIPYKGAGMATNDLSANRVQIMFAPAASVAPHIRAGRLRGIAVTSGERSKLAPDLPTVASAGLPGYESYAQSGVFAPPQTPPGLLSRISNEIHQVLHSEEVTQKLARAYVEPVGSTPEQLSALMKAEIVKWGKVIREAGISVK